MERPPAAIAVGVIAGDELFVAGDLYDIASDGWAGGAIEFIAVPLHREGEARRSFVPSVSLLANQRWPTRWHIGAGYLWVFEVFEVLPAQRGCVLTRVPLAQLGEFSASRAQKVRRVGTIEGSVGDRLGIGKGRIQKQWIIDRQLIEVDNEFGFEAHGCAPLNRALQFLDTGLLGERPAAFYDIVPKGPSGCTSFLQAVDEIRVWECTWEPRPSTPDAPKLRRFSIQWSYKAEMPVAFHAPFWAFMSGERYFFVTSSGSVYTAPVNKTERPAQLYSGPHEPVMAVIDVAGKGQVFAFTSKHCFRIEEHIREKPFEMPSPAAALPESQVSILHRCAKAIATIDQ
jgi:hypothetical protein